MAYIVQPDVVHYACTCGLLKPISKLYFCRHCLELRCGFCVCHEVDSHFCGKCAENIPSSEARLKKNRCSSCYDCPCCQHQLSLRVSSSSSKNANTQTPPAATDQKTTPKKMYYLACAFCRWNTRDVGIPDQPSASSWPERENVYSNRLIPIQEKYKAVVLWDKAQKLDREKKKQRVKYVTMTDKTGLTAAMIRKRAGLPELVQAIPKLVKEFAPSVAREEVEGLPEDIFTKALDLNEVTTLEQRLLQPELQPVSVNQLFPFHKHLSVKQSLRCRKCEHNVSKPEYNPNSIKFKIQLFAYYHIPEVRLVTVEPLRAGQTSKLIIKLCNPTQHQTEITFLSIEDEDVERNEEMISVVKQEEKVSSLHAPLSRQSSIQVKPRPINTQLSGNVVIPEATIILPPRDDAAEYDDVNDAHQFRDDPKLVIWRKSNKVALKLDVTPLSHLNIGDEVEIGFVLKHTYVNTITTADSKEPQMCEHRVKVFVSVGKIVGGA